MNTNSTISSHLKKAWLPVAQAVGLDYIFQPPYTPPGAESELGQLLWVDPPPLIDPLKRLIVVFAQKSACTNVAIWFFHQLGHGKAARDYSDWPHHYRIDVYYRSRFYHEAYEMDLSAFSLLRVVRDPFDRAASCFRHAVAHDFADKAIAKRLGRTNIAEQGLSFSEFLDFLEACDLTDCDPHFRLQKHPIEDKLPVRYLIDVSKEDLFTRLNQVEADLGLATTDFAKIPWFNSVAAYHNPRPVSSLANDAYTQRFTRTMARGGPWPSPRALLTPAAKARIARLYAVDFDAYWPSPEKKQTQAAIPA